MTTKKKGKENMMYPKNDVTEKKSKNLQIWLMLVSLLAALLGISSVTNAAAGKELTAKKTYQYDLNGGSKEKVKYTFHDGGYGSKSYYKLYINGKSVYKYSFAGDVENYVEAYLVNVNSSDKYREILFVTVGLNSSFIDARLVRVINSQKVKVIPFKKGSSYNGSVFRVSFESYDGKNHMVFRSESPYYNPFWGNYRIKLTMKVGSTCFYPVNASSYPMLDDSGSISGMSRPEYQFVRSMTLYKTASRTNKIWTVPIWTTFKPLAVKAGKKSGYYWSIYVKIKTDYGKKTGWVYIPAPDPGETKFGSYLMSRPVWG